MVLVWAAVPVIGLAHAAVVRCTNQRGALARVHTRLLPRLWHSQLLPLGAARHTQTVVFFVRRYQGGELGGATLVMQRCLFGWGTVSTGGGVREQGVPLTLGAPSVCPRAADDAPHGHVHLNTHDAPDASSAPCVLACVCLRAPCGAPCRSPCRPPDAAAPALALAPTVPVGVLPGHVWRGGLRPHRQRHLSCRTHCHGLSVVQAPDCPRKQHQHLFDHCSH